MNIMEEILEKAGVLSESVVPVILNPFKSQRMLKSIGKIMEQYKKNDLITSYEVDKLKGFVELFVKGTTKELKYRISVTAHKPFTSGDFPKRARKARKEKILFVGKVKSPFRIFKLREDGFYNVLEVLLDVMEEDVQREKFNGYFEKDKDKEDYLKKIRNCKIITIKDKKVENGEVSISVAGLEI